MFGQIFVHRPKLPKKWKKKWGKNAKFHNENIYLMKPNVVQNALDWAMDILKSKFVLIVWSLCLPKENAKCTKNGPVQSNEDANSESMWYFPQFLLNRHTNLFSSKHFHHFVSDGEFFGGV